MLGALAANIRDGTRLALFRGVRREEFTIDYPQLVALLAIGILLSVAVGHLMSKFNPEMSANDGSLAAVQCIGLLLGSAVIGLVQRLPNRIVEFLVVNSAATVALWTVILVCSGLMALAEHIAPLANTDYSAPLETPVSDIALGLSVAGIALLILFAASAFSFVISYRAIRCVFEVGAGRSFLLLVLFLVVSFTPGMIIDAAL